MTIHRVFRFLAAVIQSAASAAFPDGIWKTLIKPDLDLEACLEAVMKWAARAASLMTELKGTGTAWPLSVPRCCLCAPLGFDYQGGSESSHLDGQCKKKNARNRFTQAAEIMAGSL